jgi:hypothetical protein
MDYVGYAGQELDQPVAQPGRTSAARPVSYPISNTGYNVGGMPTTTRPANSPLTQEQWDRLSGMVTGQTPDNSQIARDTEAAVKEVNLPVIPPPPTPSGGGGGGGIPGQSAYADALAAWRNMPTADPNSLVASALRDMTGVNKGFDAQSDMINRYVQMISEMQGRGESQLGELRSGSQATLQDALQRAEERRAASQTGAQEAYQRSAQQLGATADRYGGFGSSVADEMSRSAQAFGTTAPNVGGIGDLAQAIAMQNQASAGAYDQAMAARGSIYGGLDVDVTREIENRYTNYMAQLQQQAMSATTSAEMQRIQVEAQRAQAIAQRELEAAQEEQRIRELINSQQREGLAGQAGVLGSAGSRGMRL